MQESTKDNLMTIILVIFSMLLGSLIILLLNNYSFINLNKASFKEINYSPIQVINESMIKIYKDKVVIEYPDVFLGYYAKSGSMKPVLDENTFGLKIVPKSEDEINSGDVVTYFNGEDLVIHRVIKIEYDVLGKYFIVKGDNNAIEDNFKVRFKDIRYKLVGIIY